MTIGKFFSNRDLDFFNHISEELVDRVIGTSVVIYKISLEATEENIYGESTKKTYEPGLQLYSIIEHDQQTNTQDGFGPSVLRNARFRFQRKKLRDLNFYPEKGDIVDWDSSYWEVTNVIENQFVGGKTGIFDFSIVCETTLVRRSKLNIEERIR